MRMLLLILLVSCGAGSTRTNPTPDSRLYEKYNKYVELLTEEQDSNGFIEVEKCDSLLFSALTGTALDDEINITAASSAGQWFRRPSQDCYSSGDSKSTISRDMFIGLFWYILKHDRLDLAEEIFEYGEDNNWVMGKGVISRTLFNPIIVSTLAELIYKLGGENHYVWRSVPVSWNGTKDGFESHLRALHILLRETLGLKDTGAKEVLKKLADKEPGNPLFAYGAGRYSTAAELLLDNKVWPSDRLPAATERCSPWVLERNYGKDWKPCNEDKIHSGGDFLFVAWLLGAHNKPSEEGSRYASSNPKARR